MSKYDKLLFQILRGTADANVAFEDLRGLLQKLGFEERTRSSHHIREGNKAKVYQVRQVRAVLLKYKLGGDL